MNRNPIAIHESELQKMTLLLLLVKTEPWHMHQQTTPPEEKQPQKMTALLLPVKTEPWPMHCQWWVAPLAQKREL